MPFISAIIRHLPAAPKVPVAIFDKVSPGLTIYDDIMRSHQISWRV
jgi:hypothetical protein